MARREILRGRCRRRTWRWYGRYQDWLRGDYEAVFARLDPDIEWFGPPDVSASGEPGSGLSRGHAGVRRSLETWIGEWDDYSFELRRLIDFGDDVLAEGWQRGRGRTSGVEVSEEIFSVWTIRDGQAVRQQMFRDRVKARDAVGLRE
jgi:ketosteroid isomerase-like protein